ncbi:MULTISPECIES: FAD-dependent monooxygenase [unclassified Mycobacterium]|uniref:FAD-dependent monooxygenase n=1 Tax=unclassified Mycobacterium TaxID=2642494 RepID=UPI0029C89B46|nr:MULTISPECIES: FAD-dependent monooxygenase [unclassified Mycobacterium]
MPEHVVIAGAGPNGLMLACELALAGVSPVVLDWEPGPTSDPKANGLVGQVIRLLDMRGLYHAFGGAEGPPAPVYGWMFAGLTANFQDVADNPMYALHLQQPRLVRLLEKRARDLGVDVRWSHEFTGLEQTTDGVTVAVRTPGRSYEMEARYLVGADGGRSVVRKSVGIDFPGSTSDSVTRIADVHLPDELRSAEGEYVLPGFGKLRPGHQRLDRGGGYVFFQVPGVRTMFAITEAGRLAPDAPPMSLADLRASTKRVLGVDVPFEPPRGPGPHAMRRMDGINTRLAETYRSGNVLLLGDAAHVHSPMGGPGLNLGLQDTVNLGWKLAAELGGWAPAGLLDTYESERRPVGERVMMQSLAQQALMAPGPEVGALRTLFGELLDKPEVRDHMAHLLAGSDVRYDVGDAHPLSGRLVPELVFDDGRRVAEILHDARPILLDLRDGAAASVAAGWADRVDVVIAAISGSPLAAVLLRPDGYVAWASEGFDAADQSNLAAALERWFGAASSV